jgi:hopanoid biosynthesis associated protein HpnK
MQGPRLIVHADDFGLSQKVNEGILEAHRRGILTSTSLMASGEAFDHAIQLARATPTLDVGVHLTLTEEHPVLEKDEIPTLLDEHGHFHRDARTFLKRYVTRRISQDEIRRELDAQISRVVAQDVKISHLDGHQHLHMVRGIRRIVGDLAKKHKVPAIRFPRERLKGYMLRDMNNWHRLLELLALDVFCTVADLAGAKQPDHFLGFVFGGRLTRANLAKVLEHLPATGTCELMCHPGLHDAQSPRAHWGYRWQEELDALTDKGIQDYVKANGIKLISYATLATS